MSVKSLENYIETNLEKYLSFLCDICAFEATAYDTETINKMVDYVSDFAKNEGFGVTRTSIANCGDFLSVDLNSGEEKSCVFLAHSDTVHKKGTFGSNPVTRFENRIAAPGVIDCKAGIAIALLVMAALKESGYKKHVRFLLSSDEEISAALGGQSEIDYFLENCQGFKWAINCETSEKDEVVVSRKGILSYNIDIKGVGGHSGIHYFECKNAIEEAANKILAFHSKSRVGGITYSCNIIKSGTAINAIPDHCNFTLDVRLPHHSDMEIAEQVVKEICEKSFIGDTTATVSLVNKRPPMEKNAETMSLFNDLLKVCEKYGLGSLTPVESGGGSDSCYSQMAGVPSICGMGGCGEFCHTNKEYLEIASFLTRAKILTYFLNDNN